MRHEAVIFGLVFALTLLPGCAKMPVKPFEATEKQEKAAGQKHMDKNLEEGTADMSTELTKYCGGIYHRALERGTLGDLETIREMMESLGEAGFAAADQYNQTDMKNPEQMEKFCRAAEDKAEAEQTLIQVLNNGGFVRFDFYTADGKVEVQADSYTWREGELIRNDRDCFQAAVWEYSGKGYLFFDKQYMSGFSGPYSHTAIRIKPLDNICRELNRKYILPVGYYANNLFIIDWDEKDYRNVNFYDLFELLYPLEISPYYPYTPNFEDTPVQIPREEFETVIMAYFSVSSRTLKEKTRYLGDTAVYEYSPRGLYDGGSGIRAPFPEVIDYENQEDGTIQLFVRAVWPEKCLEAALTHRVVIRPLPDGKFQYVSNRVIPSDENSDPTWYVNRLTGEK